ncbi:MAG TPA: mechanosensitive ion channel family protein [Chitinispirillaceae bacterium]|nr:mechanosensitive ion channel family protein [Chitinispirillaceae bacterium]
MSTFRLSAILAMMFFTTSISSPVDSSTTVQISQLESTVALLKDSVRLNSFIEDLEAVIQAQRMVQGTDTTGNRHTVIPSGIVDSRIIFQTLNEFTSVLSSVRSEITGYSRILSKLQEFSAYNSSTELWLFTFLVTIAIVSGFLIWGIFKRVCHHLHVTNQKEDFNKRWFGFMFLFFNRISVPAGLSVASMILSVPFGKLSPGLLLMNLAVALLIYSFIAAILELLFSKKFPQFRVLTSESVYSKAVLKSVSSVLTWALTFWLLYRITYLAGWVSTSSLIAVVYKVLLTLQLTHLSYRQRTFFSSLKSGVTTGSVADLLIRGFKFTARWVFIAVFLACSIITVTSLSSDHSLYNYLLESIVLSVLLFTGAVIVSLLLLAIIKYIERMDQNTVPEKSYIDQLLVTNKKTVEYAGFALIIIVGLSLLVKIWGFDVYRIAQSEIPLLSMVMHIFFITAGAFVTMQVTQLLIKGFQTKAQKQMLQSGTTEIEVKKRIDTLGGIFKKISAATIIVIAVIMIIDELGFDIKAMLAGVGIVGIAVGFGAQNLVRDVISGLFVIFENRIRVGDVAIINGTGGLVEQVNLRTIVLRSMDGTIHVFSNGAINSLSNMTHEYSYYVFDIGVAYKENVDRVIGILKKVGDTMITDERFKQAILEPLEIQGLDKFGPSEVVIKARIKTVPIMQWEIGREMNKRIKETFDSEGIEIPFPHQSIYFGENSKPVRVKMES